MCPGLHGELGSGSQDNLGDDPGEMGDALLAVNLGEGRTPVQLSLGGWKTCVILDNTDLKCWGQGLNGQLGSEGTNNLGDELGETPDGLPPVDLGSGRHAVFVNAGSENVCVLLDNMDVKCFGRGDYGQNGARPRPLTTTIRRT